MTQFTEEQRSAIEYRALDACVVAGPGSGKTTVLVERYRELVERHSFSPDQILAITFTEKAAANMKARLAREFRGNESRLRELDHAWVSTIHGFCARVLRENAIAAGVDPRFVVLDATDAASLQYECLNAALDEFTEARREEMLAFIEAAQKPNLASDLLSVWDAIRSSGKSIAEVRAMPAPAPPRTAAEHARELRGILAQWNASTPAQRTHKPIVEEFAGELDRADAMSLAGWLGMKCPINLRSTGPATEALRAFREQLISITDAKVAPFRNLLFDVLDRFESIYSTAKAERSALDFDDLEKRTVAMLESNSALRDRLRRKFRQVMLDEFQDVNDQQSKLINLIRAYDVFFGVGDINQSIYGFRHARPEIFRAYHGEIKSANKHSAHLLKNFRSHDGVLRCVETLLHQADGIEPRELIAKQPPADDSPAIEILRVIDGDEDESGPKEAGWIAWRILRLCEDRRHEFRDFAVLCRSRESMKPILRAFDEASIPYVCGGRDSVLESREGRDIKALLFTISNPRDTYALTTVLRSPLVGVSDEGLLRLRLLASSLASGLNAIAHDAAKLEGFAAGDAERLLAFPARLKRWRANAAVTPIDRLIVQALSDCGISWRPGTVAGNNIEAFLRIARTRGANRPLLEFLHGLASLEDAVDAESELSDDDAGNRVQVMTAHAAKGLEFRVTIIAGMHRGVQRDNASISFTPEHGLGMRWRKPGEKQGAKDSWQSANGERLKLRDREEGNRLLYVAMTRAEDRLILSWTTDGRSADNWARIAEEKFSLKGAPPDAEPRIVTTTAPNGSQWTASIFSTDTQPEKLTARETAAPPQIQFVSAPPAADRSESGIAVTSLALYNDCPRKYYLARLAGWVPRSRRKLDFARPDEDDPESAPGPDELTATELGTEVHDVLARKPGAYSDAAMQLARVFEQSPLARRSEAAARVEREWEFIADIEGMFVRGSIDLWFEEHDGSIAIVDYKTDDIPAAETTARACIYQTQLAFYALALEAALGERPIRAFLHFLRPDHVVEVIVRGPEIAAARQLVRAVRASQNELRFDLNPGDHCMSCAYYRELCPATLAAGAA